MPRSTYISGVALPTGVPLQDFLKQQKVNEQQLNQLQTCIQAGERFCILKMRKKTIFCVFIILIINTLILDPQSVFDTTNYQFKNQSLNTAVENLIASTDS